MFNVSTVPVTHYCKPIVLPVSCCLKVTVAKRWARLGKLVKFIGQPAVDALYGMEKRDVEQALGVFKQCEGLMPDRLSSIVLYMSGTTTTVLGIKREIKLARVEQLWGWHVLRPDAVTEGFVHESRGMLHYFALFCTLSGSDFVVFISLLTLRWAKFRLGPSIFVHKHTIFQLPHLCAMHTLRSTSGHCDHVQRTMLYYGPYPGPVWQLGVQSPSHLGHRGLPLSRQSFESPTFTNGYVTGFASPV